MGSLICYLENKIHTPHLYVVYANAYNVILPKLFRSHLANSIALIIGSFTNIYAVSKWKILTRGRFFWLRCLGASAVGESVYTVVVIFIVNVGIVPNHTLVEMMFVSYTFKILFDLFAIIPASLFAFFLKNKEGFDRYDHHTNFNPFKMSVDDNYKDTSSRITA